MVVVRDVQALREAEREKARQKLADEKRNDIEYLKNIMLKLFETGAPFLVRMGARMSGVEGMQQSTIVTWYAYPF